MTQDKSKPIAAQAETLRGIRGEIRDAHACLLGVQMYSNRVGDAMRHLADAASLLTLEIKRIEGGE